MGRLTITAVPAATWRPCPTCRGQRRIDEDRNGEGLVPCSCSGCLAIGNIPV
jgi:hypothetical protein